MISRRGLLTGAAAGTVAALASSAARPGTAAAAVTPNPFVRRIVIGASVSRLVASATDPKDSIRWHAPYVRMSGLDDATLGGTAYSPDGRGMATPATSGGPHLVGALTYQISKAGQGGLRPDDWLIVDYTLGTESLTAAEAGIDTIVARCIADGYRLCWVKPRVHYGAPAPASQAWMDAVAAMIDAKVPAVPVHSIVDWPRLVETWTLINPTLPQGQKDLAQPLLYDGRHPTGGSTAQPGRGCERWATAVAEATQL